MIKENNLKKTSKKAVAGEELEYLKDGADLSLENELKWDREKVPKITEKTDKFEFMQIYVDYYTSE